MKKIAIVSLGYLWFPCETGTSRFFHIAMTAARAGYDVEVITTDFQHFEKRPRNKELIRQQHYPFQITFIHAPAYRRNIGIGRILSNRQAVRNIRHYLENRILSYDAVYISIPANDIGAGVCELCRENHVPCIVDVEDLWPEAMSMVLPQEKLRNFFLRRFYTDAERVYKSCSGVVGTSEDYTARAFRHQKRDIPSATVYVGCDLADFDAGVREFCTDGAAAGGFSDGSAPAPVRKPEGEFWVTYAGSISTSYDIRTLVLAGKRLWESGSTDVRIKILGTGSRKEQLNELAVREQISNVEFLGFQPYHRMAAILTESDVVVNSFVKNAPQSMVNKIGDYLASGTAMINTLENPYFCEFVKRNRCGVNVRPENVSSLTRAILYLKENPKIRARMGINARKCAETEFDRAVSYQKILEIIETCIHLENGKNPADDDGAAGS